MTVIAFVGNKGGVGKTTLTVNFASGLALKNKVVIIDSDPQGSSLQWYDMSENPRDNLQVIPVEDDLVAQLKSLKSTYQHIVIDCPPYVQSPQTSAVLKVVDMALIPVQPSPMDLWATVHIEKVVDEARQTNSNLDVLLIINQLELRTTFSRVMRDALSEIQFSVAKTSIRRRAIYRNSALEGKSVFDMKSQGLKAAEELQELIKEVMKK